MQAAKNIMVAAGLAGILAVGTCGCSASSESSTTVTTSGTHEDGTTEETTTTTTTTTDSEGTSTETTTQESVTIDITDWTSGWIGDSDTGYHILYAEDPENGAQALLVIADPESGEYLHFVGKNTNEDGVVTITDVGNGDYFTYGIGEQNSDGAAELLLGDTYGTAQLTQVDIDTFIDELQNVDTDGVIVS